MEIETEAQQSLGRNVFDSIQLRPAGCLIILLTLASWFMPSDITQLLRREIPA
jgi:hypothetical protein